MAFRATKREAGELYTFFRLLADGKAAPGTPEGEPDLSTTRPIALIQREEHDGTRRYHIEENDIRIVSGTKDRQGRFLPAEGGETLQVPREDFAAAAQILLSLLRGETDATEEGNENGKKKNENGNENGNENENEVEIPDGLEAFLDTLRIYNLEARTDDRTDLSVAFWHADAPLSGFTVRCRLCPMNPLLDGGRTANLKFEQTGVKFAVPTVNKVNALPSSPTEVADRMRMIERLGGQLKYADVADRVFRCNLLMTDLHFPRLLAEMVRTMHLEGIARTSELTRRMRETNPLKIKEELIVRHGFYEHKVKQFLTTLALGMRPAKIYNGTDSAIEGILYVTADGEVRYYHQSDRRTLSDFLYLNTRFEKGPTEKDKYGYLERENGVWYFKLNAKIGFLKR